MSHDDEIDDIPEASAPPTDTEQTQAASFAALIDDLVAGKASPPALASEQRELLTAATVIHASATQVQLDATTRDTLIDKAFEQTLPEQLRSVDGPTGAPAPAAISSLQQRRDRRRAVPWIIAAVAAAAAVFFALNPAPRTAQTAGRAPVRTLEQAPVSALSRSRPADPLIGRIATTNSAAASRRLDRIFSDRLSGYRDLRLRRRAHTTSGAAK